MGGSEIGTVGVVGGSLSARRSSGESLTPPKKVTKDRKEARNGTGGKGTPLPQPMPPPARCHELSVVAPGVLLAPPRVAARAASNAATFRRSCAARVCPPRRFRLRFGGASLGDDTCSAVPPVASAVSARVPVSCTSTSSVPHHATMPVRTCGMRVRACVVTPPCRCQSGAVSDYAFNP